METRKLQLTLQAFALFVVLIQTGFAQQPAIDENVLPPPTGPHKTGRISFHWKDAARDELETKKADDKRELMVHLFYPTDANVPGKRAPYVPDADAMRGSWTEEQIKRLTAMRAYSFEQAALPSGAARYPVVIFMPGGGVKALIYHTLLEDLASHGWVAVAIDPPYNARAVRFPDGRLLGNLPPEERGWPRTQNRDENLRYYRENIVHWCRDVSFVIDQLSALNRGTGPFANRLNLEPGVGVFGHSRGGQAAGTVRLFDERVRGGANLDGLYAANAFQPVKGDDMGGTQPFLWLGKPLPPPPTDEQLQRARRTREQFQEEEKQLVAKLKRNLGSVTGGALRVQISRPGIAHIDFSDEPFWDGTMTETNRPGRLQTIADTRQWVRAFLDGTVRGDWNGLKRLVTDSGNSSKETTVEPFGKMWP